MRHLLLVSSLWLAGGCATGTTPPPVDPLPDVVTEYGPGVFLTPDGEQLACAGAKLSECGWTLSKCKGTTYYCVPDIKPTK